MSEERLLVDIFYDTIKPGWLGGIVVELPLAQVDIAERALRMMRRRLAGRRGELKSRGGKPHHGDYAAFTSEIEAVDNVLEALGRRPTKRGKANGKG